MNNIHPYTNDTLNSLRVKLDIISCSELDRKWADGGRTEFRNTFGRIYLATEGEGSVLHHGRMFHLRPGFLFAVPAFTPSRYICHNHMRLYSIHFTSDLLGALEPFEAMGWDFVVRLNNAEDTEQIVRKLMTAHAEKTPSAVLTANSILLGLLSAFAVTSRERQNAPQNLINRLQPVFIFIENNIHGNISLKDMANVLHLHPTYFSNLFKKTVGMPPLQYVNRQKIRHAEKLLASTDMPIQQIADKLAFTDLFYFSRVFRKVTGRPPSAYRRLASLSPGLEHLGTPGT